MNDDEIAGAGHILFERSTKAVMHMVVGRVLIGHVRAIHCRVC